MKLRFWQTASAKTAISHGVGFLPAAAILAISHGVGLLVAAILAISHGAVGCLPLPKPQFYMVLLFHEELLDKKKRFDIVEKVAEG